MPELPGGYYHDFTCPEHGVQLEFRATHPRSHRCPEGGHILEGEHVDAAWRWFVNNRLSDAAMDIAVLHAMDAGDRAGVVRSILLGYAERYATYAETPRTGENPGVATYTTLDESVWIVPLAWAYSLVMGGISAQDRNTIAEKLFIPAAEHLVRRRYNGIHNFTCWHNAAIATLGAVTGRRDLLSFAIDGPLGQRDQLSQGMLADGLWWEGSMSYHYYALWAILLSALAARHDPSLDITAEPSIAKALRAPIDTAYSSGALPATNDCWAFTSLLGECCHGVPPSRAFYEIGLALYGDAAYAEVLRRTYAEAPRDNLYALLLGPDEIPVTRVEPRRSVILPQSGLAFLRPSGAIDLMLKYGPHGAAHGHPDKLSLTGACEGWVFAPDLGTPGYGVRSLETWYRQTISHNTLMVDGVSQPEAEGVLRRSELDGVPQVADASVSWDEGVYGGVSMRRIVLACPDYFVDVFLATADRERAFDLTFHCEGTASAASLPAPADLSRLAPHGHLSDAREISRAGATHIRWTNPDGAVETWLPPKREEKGFIGRSPGNPPSTDHGFLLRHVTGTEAVFIAVVHPYRNDRKVADTDWTSERSFRVYSEDRVDEWDLSALPEGNATYRSRSDSTA